ncbi:MAG: surface-adhesin E family protein [Betaproteobacteria bacterium]
MKTKHLIASTIGLSLSLGATPAFAANWVYVGESVNNAVWYYDADSIQRSGDQVTVWKKLDHSRDRTTKIRTALSRTRYDCGERTDTLLARVSYYVDGTSKSAEWSRYEQTADTIFPESMAEAMLEAVCGVE